MKKFKYLLATPLNTTIFIDGKPVDISLSQNEVVELPEGHSFVKQLVAQGALQKASAQLDGKPDSTGKPH